MIVSTLSTAAAVATGEGSLAVSLSPAGAKAPGNLVVGNADSSTDSGKDTGDTVTISDEAKSLSAKSATSESESSAETTVQKIQKMIKEIQQQIKDAQDDPRLTKDERTAKVQLLQSQLMLLETELSKAQDSSGAYKGGTPAQGMANSLT